MFIIVLGKDVSILRESSSGPSKIQILTDPYRSNHSTLEIRAEMFVKNIT
jgi:hypothetical protein